MSATATAPARSLPPGPRGNFLLGSARDLMRDWPGFSARCAREFGDVVFYRFLHVPICQVTHPDGIEQILVRQASNFHKSKDYTALKFLLGNGLLTNEGASWQAQRQLMQPAFRHESMTDLAGGPGAAGEFGPFAISVLLSDADPLSIRYLGLSPDGLAKFSYSVPRINSHFALHTISPEGTMTAYQGLFLLDPNTAALKRIIVNVPRPPPDVGISALEIAIEYGAQQIGEKTAWLPRASTMRMVTDTGQLGVNEAEYGPCREYSSESTLSFDVPPPPSRTGTAEVPKTPVPAGYLVHTRIATELDSARTFAGDPVELVVLNAIRERGEVILPAKARIFGRVVEMRRIFRPTKGVVLAIRFQRAEFNGSSRPISLASFGPPHALLGPVPVSRGGGPEHAATIMTVGSDKLHIAAKTVWDWETR